MSQYKSGNYVYGYDAPMSEYFLMEEINNDMEILVGTGSSLKGNKTNLLSQLNKLKIKIPKAHKTKISMDLPV